MFTKREKVKKQKKFNYVFYGIMLVLSVAILAITFWAKRRLNVTIEEVLFTLGTPLRNAGGAVIADGLKKCLPPIILTLVLYVVWALYDSKKTEEINEFGKKFIKSEKYNLSMIVQNTVAVVTAIAMIASVVNFYVQFGLIDYITLSKKNTIIYDEEYINPNDVEIKAGEKGTKNLICIYLESMENMYSSKENGGNQEENLIPNLTKYAEENISFSNSETLGGFYGVSGTTWTIGALFATTSGVPLKGIVDKSEEEIPTFASGITTLGDILESKGYNQEFLCGSDGDYAGRATYFKEHGNYKIFDLFSARENGYIEDDYYVWWGYEDKYLYEIAKDELTQLAKKNEPFNFTMLTVDTHYPDGYVCELCKDEYEQDVENVIKCADTQINQFVKWIKEQDFYKDTVIVIMGDHARMDIMLMEGIEDYQRTMYNCIINSDFNKEDLNVKNRTYCSMDMFPTILAAMGFEIEGNRLGLGTNLFSNEPTLMEKMGMITFDDEIGRKSQFYDENFQ